ncbi:hypothetical protein [Nocardia sp. NBC_00403]|uniref:hypothetical protein n=1 Tax=Nocardia sp. NBC_00403 TaxID=2975990 RepID=UPI002E2273A9
MRKLAVHGYHPAEPERLPNVDTAANSDRTAPASGSRTPCTTVDFDALTVGAELPILAFDHTLGLAASFLSAWLGDPADSRQIRSGGDLLVEQHRIAVAGDLGVIHQVAK